MLTNSATELPNPHIKCVRQLLNCLAISDYEYQRINIELRNTQKELKQSIDNVIYKCSEMRKLACASEERLKEFQNNVKNIDAIRECFNKRIEELQNKRENMVEASKNGFIQLAIAKTKLKQFHHKSIDYLKTFAIQSNDAVVVKNCEKDVNKLNQQFAQEISYIKKCESVLSPFFQLLDKKCNTQKSENNHFDEYDWVPQGKSLEIVDSIAKEIKVSMAITLRKAFAHLHIHQPSNRESFLAKYLMTMQRSEEIIKEKLARFTNK